MNQELQTKDEKTMEFVPFGAEQKIKLSVNIVKTLLAKPTKSGRTCSDRDALKFMMLCSGRGLNPFEGDAFLVGYDSNQNGTVIAEYSLITAHQALLKRAEIHPQYAGMESGIIIKTERGALEEREGKFYLPEEEMVGGWCRVHLKERKVPQVAKLALRQRFKETRFWKDDPAGQIVKCAEAEALRKAFPTKLGGLYLAEEIEFPISGRVSSDLPSDRLLAEGVGRENLGEGAVVDGPTENTPAQPQESRGTSSPVSPANAASELAQFVVTEGYTFSQFQTWAIQSGNWPEADAAPGFEAVPEAIAKRLLRAKVGLKKGLERAKGAA